MMLEVINNILSSSKACSKALNYVPRPGFVDKGYLLRQLRGIARRMTEGGLFTIFAQKPSPSNGGQPLRLPGKFNQPHRKLDRAPAQSNQDGSRPDSDRSFALIYFI